MTNDSNCRSNGFRRATVACLAVLLLVIAMAGCASGGSSGEITAQPDAAAQTSRSPKASRTVSSANTTSASTARATRTPTRRAPCNTATPTVRATRRATPAPTAKPKSSLPTVRYQDLPKQAKDTIRLIDQGGPFPFDRDGITFQNREQLLPKKPNGYYSEYTVITPGSSDRGAWRIIAGDGGELYYTDDHYDSFREVI